MPDWVAKLQLQTRIYRSVKIRVQVLPRPGAFAVQLDRIR
jgi:hypothetical protein